MRFGSREVADVVFRAKATQRLGSRTFYKDEPVLYFDTLKTSGLEGASSTVYAQGGRGNPRLIAWEGERTMTFTMEDALISPEGLAILTGAGIISAGTARSTDADGNVLTNIIYQHVTSRVVADADAHFEVPNEVCYGILTSGETEAGMKVTDTSSNKDYHENAGADVFVMKLDNDGLVAVEPCVPGEIKVTNGKTEIACKGDGSEGHSDSIKKGDIVLVDYYVARIAKATQIEITADKFGGYYYIEASTLFRDEATGEDLPAEFIIPKGKVQSNFNFAMANSGDPSTFTFTVDAMPDYVKFDRTHKVLAAIQIIEDLEAAEDSLRDACEATLPNP